MKLAYLVVCVIAVLWLFTVITTEPPNGLNRTPPTHWWITLQEYR